MRWPKLTGWQVSKEGETWVIMPVTSQINYRATLMKKDSWFTYTLSQSSHGIATVAMNSLQKINSLNIIAKRYIALTSSFTFVNLVTAVKCQSAQVSIWYVVQVFLQQSTSWNLNVTFVNFQVIPKTVSKFISVLLIEVSITRNWRRNVRTSNGRNQNLHIW